MIKQNMTKQKVKIKQRKTKKVKKKKQNNTRCKHKKKTQKAITTKYNKDYVKRIIEYIYHLCQK